MNQTTDNAQNHAEAHEGPIKTPKQLIVTVILAFILPIIIIFLLISLVLSSSTQGAGSRALTPEAIASRIKPVADFALVDANAPKVLKTGPQVYESTCAACHTAGIAGAPKLGELSDWAPLIDSGMDAMMQIALEGKGAMPPKGGNPTLTDLEIERAVVYMANESGGDFPVPEDPADEEATADAPAESNAEEAPAAEPATTEAPAAETTATEEAADAPAAQAPASEEPAAEESAADAPAAEEE